MNNNKNFWDLNRDGKFDFTDIAMGFLYFICLTVGGFLMVSTFGRSLHLLTSSAFMPKGQELGWIQNLWPYITGISSEAGLVIAWISCELGFRKGNLWLALFGIFGGALFGTIIATLGLYDTAMIGGSDITEATTWGHFVTSILPMFTIFYAATCTMLLSAMSRIKDISQAPVGRVTIENVQRKQQYTPQRPERQLPREEQEERYLGEPVSDPTRKGTDPKGRHSQAELLATQHLERMKSLHSNNGHTTYE